MITLGPSNRSRGGRPRRNAPLITTTHAFASCPSECGAEVARVWSREPTPPSHRLGHRVLECVSCGATWLGAEWIFASGAGDCYRGCYHQEEPPMSVITIPDPTVPRLLTLDEDSIPERKSLGDPAQLVPPSAWVSDPNASCRTVHLANEMRPGVGDMSRLRGRVLLAIELPGKTIALLLHPEVAAGWAHGLSVAVQGAMELPPTPAAAATTTEPESEPAK